MTRILGILNVTRDSFSDGGRCLDAEAAIAHGRRLASEGADLIDIGAESTHPDSEDVPAEVETARLEPVVAALKADGLRVSVDTSKAPVMRRMLRLGVDMINDVTALRDPDSVAAVLDSGAAVVLMHSVGPGPRADRWAAAPTDVLASILAFFERRMGALERAGLARGRLVLDPGMGFFLGPDASTSLAVLRGLERLRALGAPLLISTSRKSFIGALLADESGAPRPVEQRAAGTLATEIWAALRGVDYIRTHDVRQLRDALRVLRALQERD